MAFDIKLRIRRRLLTTNKLLATVGFTLAIVFTTAVPAVSQAWSGILDPSRATDWTHAGIPGGIPSRTAVCQTVAPSGQADATDSNNIENALTACAGRDQVVQLLAGRYTLAAGVLFNQVSHVVLRGAGPDKTKLVFTGLASCRSAVCVSGGDGWAGKYPGATTWSGGYAQDSTTLTVGSTKGMSTTPGATGNIIYLDQREDSIGICPARGGTGHCTIAGATESGTTATIVTSLPHGFNVGQAVGVGGVSNVGYNTSSNTANTCNNVVGCQWWTITDVGCVVSGSYVSSAGCGPNPIIAFQFKASSLGLPASGGGFATVDTGGVFTSGVPSAVIDENATQGRRCPAPNYGGGGSPECAPGEISLRSQTEIHQVTSIVDGTHITVDPPVINTNWRASQNPGIWWTAKVMLDGVEAMTLDFTNDNGTGMAGGVVFTNCFECWEKDVRSINGNRNHVWITGSYKTDIEDNYFYGTKARHSKSYGVETFLGTNDLVQNNICQHVVSCVMDGQEYGGVFAYNYAVDSGYKPSDWFSSLLANMHDYSTFNLFEGNDTPGTDSDNTHGTGGQQTFFRSRMRGFDMPPRLNPASLVAIRVSAFNRADNFIGNVIGWPGMETSYESTGGPTIYPPKVVWSLNMQGEHGFVPADLLVSRSLLRWGNYDVATGTVRWCGDSSSPTWSTVCNRTSEIPTTAITFINGNPVPSSATLPASFYLGAQPSFWVTTWGTPPWPAIGPDAQGGTSPDSVAGHSYAIPAQLCYLHTSVDPAYQQTDPTIRLFNAATCYPSAYGRVSSPMNLKAVVR